MSDTTWHIHKCMYCKWLEYHDGSVEDCEVVHDCKQMEGIRYG